MHLQASVGTTAAMPLWHLGADLGAVRSTAVANHSEKKREFQEGAAGLLRVPSQIAQRNQPPAARPTAALLSRDHFYSPNQTLTDRCVNHRFGASGLRWGCKEPALSAQRQRGNRALNLRVREAEACSRDAQLKPEPR